MATKNELLTQLTARVLKVMRVQQVGQTVGGVTTYDVTVATRLPNGTVTVEVQPLYVVDEGLPGETAYYAREEKQNAPADTSFVVKLKAAIANREAGQIGGIKKIVIDMVDNAKEFALVTAYRLANGSVSVLRHYVGLDGSGNIEIFPLA